MQASLLIRSLIRSNKPTSYKRKIHGFLELVSETYNDDEVFEWQPAPSPESKPNEPGNLGNIFVQIDSVLICYKMDFLRI